MGFPKKEQITFFLTSRCNLDCGYCYMPKLLQSGLRDQQLDLDFAKAGLADFFGASTSRTIRFFAPGEPTLAFRRMVEIWEFAKQLAGDDLRTEIETNGYFGAEVAGWIEDHVDYLWISCDGWEALQDSQRPRVGGGKSSDLVLSNVRRFAKKPGMQTGVRATIGAENLDRQIDLVEFFHSLGVKYLAASPTYHSLPNPEIQTPSLLGFAEHFVPAYYRAQELDMTYLTLLIVNFDEDVSVYCQAHTPTPRLTTDGFVSSCDWAAFGSPDLCHGVQNELIYGRFDPQSGKIVYDSAKLERIRRRNTSYLGIHHCRGCPALSHCAGGCVGKMAAATGDFFVPSEAWCEAVLYLLERLPVNDGPFEVLHP